MTTAQAGPAPGPRLGGKARVVAVVFAAVFLTVLNGSIVNVVLPVIGSDLAVEPALLGWVVNSYSLVYAVAIPFFGRLADIFGARRFFVAGQALFAIGSLLCVLAPSFTALLVARVVQSAGGAAIPGLGTTLLSRTFPPQQMGTIAGLNSTMIGVAFAIGPTIGGWLTGAFSWHAAFALGALAGLLVPVSWTFLPRDDPDRDRAGEPLDVWGGLFLAAAISGGLFAVTESARNGPGSPSVFFAGAVSVIGIVALVVRHRMVEYPFIPRALLASAGYRAVSTITICAATSSVGVMVGVPLLLARMNGLSAAEIGLLMVPNAVLSMSMGVVIGRFADRVGSRIPARFGLLLMLAAVVGLSSSVGFNGWVIAGLLAMLGLGSAFVNTPMPAAVSRLVAPEQLASGQSMTTMLFFLGGSLGATLITAVLSARSLSIQAVNPIHNGAGGAFSDAFLLLAVPLILASLLTPAVPGRMALPPQEPASPPPSIAPLLEPTTPA